MSNVERLSPQVEIIKDRARELSERMALRHDPNLVKLYVEFSLGAASLTHLLGDQPDDILLTMQSGARLAARNLDPDNVDHIAASVLGDEELSMEILATNLELLARGDHTD